jgi:hypothetical protein
MNGQRTQGTLGVYDAVDAAAETIERLRAAGIKRMTVFSPCRVTTSSTRCTRARARAHVHAGRWT